MYINIHVYISTFLSCLASYTPYYNQSLKVSMKTMFIYVSVYIAYSFMLYSLHHTLCIRTNQSLGHTHITIGTKWLIKSVFARNSLFCWKHDSWLQHHKSLFYGLSVFHVGIRTAAGQVYTQSATYVHIRTNTHVHLQTPPQTHACTQTYIHTCKYTHLHTSTHPATHPALELKFGVYYLSIKHSLKTDFCSIADFIFMQNA